LDGFSWSTLEEGRQPTLYPLAVDVLNRGDTEILVRSYVVAVARLGPWSTELHGRIIDCIARSRSDPKVLVRRRRLDSVA
jgi:hypothetical protein